MENIYLISHDLDFTCNIIPMNHKLKRIFCLSEWHVEYFGNVYNQIKPLLSPLNYGIDIDLFKPEVNKIPYKFIYSSFPDRGLLPLLEMWPKILNKYPKATLHIHSDLSNKNKPEEINKIKELLYKYNEIKNFKKSLFYNIRTSKKELINDWKTTDIWFYPCTYLETFCYTTIEAAISKTLVITANLGSLKYTVGDRGILLDGNFYNSEFQDKALDEIFKVIDDKELKNSLIEKNYNWAINLTWENRAKILFDEYLKPTINFTTDIEVDDEYLKPTINFTTDIEVDEENIINLDNKFNWINDLPSGTYKNFVEILKYVNWKNLHKQINVLEVGAYTGKSLIKMLEFFTNYKATVIDSWKDRELEEIFYENIQNANIENLNVIKNHSFLALYDLIKDTQKFDFIYVDSSYTLLDSYNVILYSFILLNEGGIMVIDNYNNFKPEIDKFLKDFSSKLSILNKDYIVFIEKI